MGGGVISHFPPPPHQHHTWTQFYHTHVSNALHHRRHNETLWEYGSLFFHQCQHAIHPEAEFLDEIQTKEFSPCYSNFKVTSTALP
jgi:hypothetical protein